MIIHPKTYGSMLNPEVATARLKESGARMTTPRRCVIEILTGNRSHPTAEAVVSLVQAKLGYVSPATIYNTLEALSYLGLVRRIEGLESRSHFDPDTSDHQHAICRKCKRVWDIDLSASIIEPPTGFIVEDILIQGLCKDCSRRDNDL